MLLSLRNKALRFYPQRRLQQMELTGLQRGHNNVLIKELNLSGGQ
jgi:hypothetical protein